jgi:hypothetical protein
MLHSFVCFAPDPEERVREEDVFRMFVSEASRTFIDRVQDKEDRSIFS